MRNIVFNIQRFCTEDGPGIRTAIFLKGCPLRCRWCHNPESQNPHPELMYNPSLCIGCGGCVGKCEQNAHVISDNKHIFLREKCNLCEKCCDVCPTTALEMAGYETCVAQIMEKSLSDLELYKKTGGGITLSGGEPLLQPEFSYEILKAAKENGIHTCVETCGYAKYEDLAHIASVTDLFLYDWKITKPDLHKKYTGVDNALIKENLLSLDKSSAKIILRCPIIPTVNDTDEHFEGIAALANTLANIVQVDVEPYNPLGKHKKEMLGKNAGEDFPVPTKEDVEIYIEKIAQKTDVPVKKA